MLYLLPLEHPYFFEEKDGDRDECGNNMLTEHNEIGAETLGEVRAEWRVRRPERSREKDECGTKNND